MLTSADKGLNGRDRGEPRENGTVDGIVRAVLGHVTSTVAMGTAAPRTGLEGRVIDPK